MIAAAVCRVGPQAFIISAQASPRILTPFSMASSVELE